MGVDGQPGPPGFPVSRTSVLCLHYSHNSPCLKLDTQGYQY